MKQRLYSDLKKLAFILIIGIIYYIWVLFTDHRIPCVFNLITGLLCPGCGVTRMIVYISKLDFANAYACNKMMFVTWPLIVAFILYNRIRYIRTGSSLMPVWTQVLMIAYIVVLILFAVIRNIL